MNATYFAAAIVCCFNTASWAAFDNGGLLEVGETAVFDGPKSVGLGGIDQTGGFTFQIETGSNVTGVQIVIDNLVFNGDTPFFAELRGRKLPSPPSAFVQIASTDQDVSSATIFAAVDPLSTYRLRLNGDFPSLITNPTYGFSFGELSVSAVPLPAAAWLMVGGLGAIAAYGRRARKMNGTARA